ncbi:hypothetical protein AB1Y20_001743 [Prymnesium parvum]|uniref:Chromo domain-containing protein n=1 Tax=Prymnesium parvum TaxID=97485 RepID=A0AB34KCK3_PRYPA
MGFKADLVERLLDAVAGTEAVGSSDSEAASTTEWKVKKIIGRRSTIKTVQGHLFEIMEFQVQWDFPDHDDPTADEVTWEPLSNLENAHEALHDFLASQPKQPSCKYGHMLGTCRCQRPLIHSGQDESIFKAYQKSSYQWVVGGVRGLRKKTDGPGEMVSGFKDELRGFGHPLTEDELLVVNCYREALGKQPLKGSPGVRFLQYGKNKEGYWTFDHFAEQAIRKCVLMHSMWDQ